jgi:hypothetical protein
LAVAAFRLFGAFFSSTSITAIAAQILGITVTSVYYFSALTNLNISPSRWMEMYIRVAFVITILGFAQWVTDRILHHGDGRLMSIFLEPSHYIFLTLPAIGYSFNRYVSDGLYGWESTVFLLSYLLADSSLGFLGLLLIGQFTYTPRLKGWHILLAVGMSCILVGALYAASKNFRVRADDTVLAIVKQDLGGTNASTFALLSNVYVTGLSLKAYPLTGVGIGGYAAVYDTFIRTLSGPGLTYLDINLNRDDANSLFLRVAAELGLPGLFVLIGFIFVCARVRGPPYLAIRNAMVPYFLIRMGRFGAYFSPELYFFVGLYVLNYLQSRTALRQLKAP